MTGASKEYRIVTLVAGVPQIEQATDPKKALVRAEGFRKGGYSNVSVQERLVGEWKEI